MTTGQRIKAARKKAGMTQAELANKLGISYVGVSQWERDLRNPKIETLRRIADALDCPIVFLAGNTDSGNRIQKELVLNNDLSGLDEFFGREPGTFEGIEKAGEKITSVDGKTIKTTKYKLKIKGYDGNAYFLDREIVGDIPSGQNEQEKISDVQRIADEMMETGGYYRRSYLDAFNRLNDAGKKKAIERVEELTEIPKYQRKPPQEASAATSEGTDTTPTENDATEPPEAK